MKDKERLKERLNLLYLISAYILKDLMKILI